MPTWPLSYLNVRICEPLWAVPQICNPRAGPQSETHLFWETQRRLSTQQRSQPWLFKLTCPTLVQAYLRTGILEKELQNSVGRSPRHKHLLILWSGTTHTHTFLQVKGQGFSYPSTYSAQFGPRTKRRSFGGTWKRSFDLVDSVCSARFGSRRRLNSRRSRRLKKKWALWFVVAVVSCSMAIRTKVFS